MTIAWSYSGDPSLSKKDELRFLIGDVDGQDPLMSDGEINYLLLQCNQNALLAAIKGCDLVAMKFARLADESVGQVRISYSQKYQAYLKMKDALRQRQAIDDCMPYAGGISESDKQTRRDNEDRVVPVFHKHQMEERSLAVDVNTELDDRDHN